MVHDEGKARAGDQAPVEGSSRPDGRDDLIAQQQQVILDLDVSLRQRDAVIAGQKERLKQQHAALDERMWQVAEKDQALERRDRRIAELQGRFGNRLRGKMRALAARLAPWGTRRRGFLIAVRRGLYLLRHRPTRFLVALVTPWRWIRELGRPVSLPQQEEEEVPPLVVGEGLNIWYQRWLWDRRVTSDRRAEMDAEAASFAYRPTISIVMPTYNSEQSWLEEAVRSVTGQVYDAWELCIADDASTRPETRTTIQRLAASDPRIKVVYLQENRGIAGASNAALDLASGEFVAFLDHDDVLATEALFEVVRLLNDERDLDYIYTDEDKLTLEGRRVDPFFKPDWSPDLLLSVNYVTHFSVYRRDLVERLGRLRAGYEGSQDYDLVLRVTEETDRIGHAAVPVYSWRMVEGSAAASDEAKPHAYEAAKAAIGDALERRGRKAEVLDGPFLGYYRVRYEIPQEPRVTILIPTHDRAAMLRRCIRSIQRKTTYENYEIVIVDNQSREADTLAFLDRFEGRVIDYPFEFQYARMMNVATRQVEGDMIVFLNNDTEVISEQWLEALVEHGQHREVASVGARLLYPNGNPQHEGTIVGPGRGLAGNVDTGGYFGLGACIRNVSAVTAAAMLIRHDVFWELGGFDEELGVAYNDVDLCLRAREKGYLIVYTPYAELYHYEGGTRGRTGRTHPEENERTFRERWAGYRDPYYNPNFDIDRPFRLPKSP